ncbi:Serine/threonine-protein kinase tel1 [Ascosphaera pollenicola]|nr:Serine/threonine-protein kinase tel1 [Ascosphaera pollenicola]
MYRVFESAGQIPQSSPYATRCLETVSRSLQLNGPKDIFRVFASQLLYTWLEPRDEGIRQSLASIPFTIFGYFSLKDMLLEVQDEIIGQIMLRAHNEEMDEISSILERPLTDLLATSFAKCEAYVVASSISVPPSPLPQKTGGEKQIKQLLGKDKFYELLIKSLPSIIATLIRRVDEPGIESLKRFSDLHAVSKWNLIDQKYHSDISIPIGQQPCFRSKYLYDELFYICRRVNMPINQMWNSSLFCYVARSLMETVKPALGSLHACAVLRKLKMLLCISGDVVFQGYGSPMILHFLRPFLTDKWCCGDALGMFWYLYENRNKESLFGTSFEIGLSVSSLASLRAFMLLPGHLGEQGTLSKSASSALKQFLHWFPQHLSTFSADICGADEGIISFFHKLIQLTKDSEGRGRSHSHTAAGRLLLLLLEDQASSQPILVDPAKEQLFNFLGHDFQRELQSHLDILGTDDKAIAYALNAWRCCPDNRLTIPYKLWVARALGRAYASSGKLDQSLLREQKDCYHTTCLEYPALSSKLAIVKVLCDNLMSSSPNHVGLAERTLQMMIQRLGSNSVASECQKAMPQVLIQSFHWGQYTCPGIFLTRAELGRLYHGIRWNPDLPVSEWARELAIYLCQMKSNDAVIGCLPKMVYHLPDLAEQFLPYIIHDVLLSGSDGKARHRVSAVFNQAFESESKGSIPHIKLIIKCILYLRHQPYPQESNADDRDFWLDINYNLAASAAERCDMRKTALLFIEICTSRLEKASRRRLTGAEPIVKAELLDRIFKSIDDPDLPYGIEKKLSPEAILDVLSYDCSSTQKLSFLTASHDANIRLSESFNEMNQVELVETLNELNFQGLASDLLTATNNASEKAALSTALYLQQWDIPVSSTNTTPTASVFKALKCLNTHNDEKQILSAIDESFLSVAGRLMFTHSLAELKECMCCLANLTEIDEIISTDPEKIRQQWERICARNHWLKFESFADINQLLLCREAMFSSLARSSSPTSVVNFDPRTSRELQFRTIQESLRISRDHNELQVATKSAVLLTKLVPLCKQQGLSVDIAAQFELAQVLWDQGETARSIQLLKDIQKENLAYQTVEVDMSRVLSTLGHRIAEARLEDPRDIRDHYLQPASDWLTKDDTLRISDRGKVFHDFAVFCDRQVSNQDVVEDLRRLEGAQSHKEEELLKYNSMLAGANGEKRRKIQHDRNKARAWLELVHNELAMQKEAHESLKISAVLNYLQSLADSDDYKSDVLRFCALWMDNADNDTLNAAVSNKIELVPSRRFAPLVNQLFSRLDDVVNYFQEVLQNLLLRICTDHPYHGMYQAFMSSNSCTDEASKHRNRAANMLASKLKIDRLVGAQWDNIYNANLVYLKFAQEVMGGKIRSGTKISLARSEAGFRLANSIPKRKLPPPTMKIEVREDCDYSQVPVVVQYLPECSIASGVSAPKIVTAIASDGKRYKQLFKTGNDDLRQDLVMEQVFEQVSGLLKEHRETRQRELGIRTYKVVPLTTNTGVIEFVQNTIPLNDYLLPAHASHFPRDMDFNQARYLIVQAQNKSLQERLKAYKQVTNNFHPVLRFFFMEKFLNPDDWFSKRLAYTRSTAAISILGHILGLGDRHGHNILLDEQTGEVIHIDLGVAFEQGRILPVPEVVPFRLTRDLVDGMGITKTEGVFRRSCEFTLAALRRESYSIMTILDVLRYDPLYNWSLSPTRAKKMQDTQEAGDIHANGKKGNEPSEANRSLAVVAKKLGETLSVSATVSELIQQATDERNLAVLYCGWAAFI